MEKVDLIIVGAGVLGTFHALHALEMGLSVRLLEKNRQPQGATVRNFGQIVPSGMSAEWQGYGRESLQIYKRLQDQVDITVRQQGSIYLASNEGEMALLYELQQINQDREYPCTLLGRDACLERYPGLKSDYCTGGLFFPEEISVEPRRMVSQVLQYLETKQGFSYHPGTLVIGAWVANGQGVVEDSRGNVYVASKVIICNGTEFQTLYPDLFAASDIEVTKLQMMQTVAQPNLKLPGNILTGLSIRRYESFSACPSYTRVRASESPDTPWKRWGIHILFKQAVDGSVIIGDSHQYADAQNQDTLGFDEAQDINRYILTLAQDIFKLEDWTLQRQWSGFYSQIASGDLWRQAVDEHIHIVTGIGGKGMTAGPGYSRVSLQKILS